MSDGANRGQSPDLGPTIEGPFEHDRTIHTWWWERPDGYGDLGYNRLDVLLRCASIFGGRVKCIRMIEHSTTTVHVVSA